MKEVRTVHNSNVAFVALVFFALFSCSSSAAIAQIKNIADDTSTPVPGSGHDYIHILNETVNPANGSVSLGIQVPMPKGRGLNLPFSFLYNSNGTIHSSQVVPGWAGWASNAGPMAQGGWSYSIPSVSDDLRLEVAGDGQVCTFTADYVFNDPTGGRHSLNPIGAPQLNVIPGTTTPISSQACDFVSNVSNWTSGGDQDYTASLGTYNDTVWPITVFDNFGTSYSFADGPSIAFEPSPVLVEDRNGNEITINPTSTGGATYTDTLGRTALSVSGFGPSGTTNTVAVSGLSAPYQVAWETVPVSYSVPQQPLNTQDLGIEECTFLPVSASLVVVKSITLPNNVDQYTFQYDPTYGLLSKIVYPNGAWISYTWKFSDTPSEETVFSGAQIGQEFQGSLILEVMVPGTSNPELLPPGFPVDSTASPEEITVIPESHSVTIPTPNACQFIYSTPVVGTRSVGLAGSTTPILQQSFTYSTTWNTESVPSWTQKQTTVTTTDEVRNLTSTTVHTYSAALGSFSPNDPPSATAAGPQIPTETLTKTYDWGNSTSPVDITFKAWYNPFFEFSGSQAGISLLQLACEFHTSNNGQSAGHFYQYTLGQISDDKEYQFGQVTSPASVCTGFNPTAPAGPIRETVTNFQSVTGPLGATFGEPSSVVVNYNGAEVTETDNLFDHNTLVPVSATSHDERNYGPSATGLRGNVTSVTRKCLQGCTNATTTYTYDETGQVQSMTEPCGNTVCPDMTGTSFKTTYSYADSPSGGNSAGNSNAYLTQITYPNTGVAHVENYMYSYPSGLLAEIVDENSQPTTYSYIDPFLRLTDVYGPPSSQNGNATPHTHYGYVDGSSPSIMVTNPIGVESETLYDGLGRATQTQLINDPNGADFVNTAFDGTGHVYTKSNPKRSATSSSDGTTTYYYDALGRTIEQVEQDGSTLQTCYNGVTSTPAVSNCNSHHGSISIGTWADSSDEIGNDWQRTVDSLGRLTEVMEPNGSTQSPTMETDYVYDGLNDLMSVTQWGGASGSSGARTRSFSYDSLSRLLTASNPETGAVSYGYDANSNVQTKTDARGVTTTFGYDALNRVLNKSYSNDASNTPFSCYQYDLTSVTNGIGRLSNAWTQRPSAGACPAAPGGAFLTKRSIHAYDTLSRLLNEQQYTPASQVAGTFYAPAYTYDLAGNLLTSTDGTTSSPTTSGIKLGFTYTYDSAARLLTVGSNSSNSTTYPATLFSAQTGTTTPCSNSTTAPYAPFGGLMNATFGIGTSTTALTLNRAYDNRLRTTCETDTGSAVTNGTPGSATVIITGSEQTK